MLTIGGLLTAVFVLYKWGVSEFIRDLSKGMDKDIDGGLVKILFSISAIVVGFILLNEIISLVTGSPIVG